MEAGTRRRNDGEKNGSQEQRKTGDEQNRKIFFFEKVVLSKLIVFSSTLNTAYASVYSYSTAKESLDVEPRWNEENNDNRSRIRSEKISRITDEVAINPNNASRSEICFESQAARGCVETYGLAEKFLARVPKGHFSKNWGHLFALTHGRLKFSK